MKLTYENVRSVLRECGPLTMHEVAKFFPRVPYCSACHSYPSTLCFN